MDMTLMFILLFTTGLAVTGVAGYLIFGPLSYVQARDRGIRPGTHAFAPGFLRWISFGRFRETRDPAITGLATPAQILIWCALLGAAGTALVLIPIGMK
ncbi:hypothetical protein [Pseudomarimonas arenosa]|uniref:Uncharacterized protein n=1 Tax=Pseudomarimonas arenosa TaxID=2774145 RepID=A0AAW3ZPX5_9GAMM|nr:hypothetical protein [Pseudomarimonas arenosa]MBD8527539.1 hypothetical protein [Pseudomarimonas arenosa]